MHRASQDRESRGRAPAGRPGRPGRWTARLLALALLAQAGSPAFVSACERSAGGDAHGCPACRPEAAASAAPAPVPACHAAALPAPAAAAAPAPAPKPCCFLEATPALAHAALPEVTLAAGGDLPLPGELAGDPDGTMADRLAPAARCGFPPGCGPPASSGPPAAVRTAILRL